MRADWTTVSAKCLPLSAPDPSGLVSSSTPKRS